MNSVAIGVLPGLIVLPACSEEPSAKGVNSHSPAQEIELGRQTAADLERTLPIVHEPKQPKYAGHEDEDRKLLAMPADAFEDQVTEPVALPGGPIFVPLSLLAAAPGEALFAFRLSYAMAHVSLRHATPLATLAQIANLANARLHNASFQAAGSRKFARRLELQAGTVATNVLAAAGAFDEAEAIAARLR